MGSRIKGYCTLCRSRCGSETVVANNRIVSIQPLEDHPTGGALCAKGRALPELVHNPARLRVPLKRLSPKGTPNPQWQEISWEEALSEIAAKLGSIRETHGAEAVAFAVTTPSGTPMVDSFEWVERFIRCFGSPNLIYAVEVCGWHKDYAHELTFGRGIGYPDYENADVIVLWGHNPARTWLAQASRIAEARSRGAKIVVIDPKPDGSGQQADLWLRVRPGADAAVAMGAIRHLIETGTFDASFVKRWTNAPMLVNLATGRLILAADLFDGAEPNALIALDRKNTPVACNPRATDFHADDLKLDAEITLKSRDGTEIHARTVFALLREAAEIFTAAHVSTVSWVDETVLKQFYALLERNPKLAYHSWTGVGQQTNATAIERAIATLYALTGAYDLPGGNIWPTPPPTRAVNQLSLLPEGQKEKALGLDELPLGPPARGWITARDFARAVTQHQPYRVRALMSFGTNFVASQADAKRNLEALRALDFHVHTDIYMNPTAEYADIVLPVNLSPERDALKIGFEINQAAVEIIQFRPKMIECEFDARADYEIAFDLACRLGHADDFFGGDIVKGWNWQLEPLGVTIDELRAHPGGKRFPQQNDTRKYAQTPTEGELRGFPTRSGLVELYSEQLLDIGFPALARHVEPQQSPIAGDAAYPLVLTTAKSGWFVHTSHRHISSLRKKAPDPIVEINSQLARSRKLSDGDWAHVITPSGRASLRVKVNDALEERVVIAEFGWWQSAPALNRPAAPVAGIDTRNINAVLSDASRDPVSGSVPLRAILCDIRPHPSANIGHWSGWRDFIVSTRRSEAHDVVALELAPVDGGPLPGFLPGQHVTTRIRENGPSRAYSLTGAGISPDRLSIAVRCQGTDIDAQEGRSLSAAIHRLSVGEHLQLQAPAGIFTPPTQSSRPLIFLAAGIGITPFISALERIAHETSSPEILLLHGCRSSAEHPFAQHLRELEVVLPGLRRVTAYSSPLSRDVQGHDFDLAGRVDFSAALPFVQRNPLVYICGSPGFTDSAKRAMRSIGIPAFDIFSEAFISPKPIPSDLKPQTVRIAGTERSFEWRPEMGSLLDAALSNGFSLPSGCRVGQCESCICKLVDGKVAHLGGDEIEADQCLTCQAVPLTQITLAT
ncbi:molybdopterin oxidoreductase [Brucella pseudogrignonensis]|uniref:molybdopterin-dependent oxidoreductase n=1 Tax=Brucella pseudogrignonensis TaxID=419475 RepID=UPI0007DA927F|nr:molybdopterin-dependent oxidoreductase [Brucella pseudogrignonensis]ANG98723.1 molybdopterin oxidoreductase [Brucella pseudogrignonensis]